MAIKSAIRGGNKVKIFNYSTNVSSRKGSGITWSPTNALPEFKIRQPGEKVPFPLEADFFPLGPLPADVRDSVSGLWALTATRNEKLPDWFMSLERQHFTGMQAVNEQIADVYRALSSDKIEIIQIPKMWSIKDKAHVAQPYYFINLYDTEETVDLERSNARSTASHPQMSRAFKYSVSYGPLGLKVREGFTTAKHVWRDSNTSDWFCDEVFRAALEKASRGSYSFYEYP